MSTLVVAVPKYHRIGEGFSKPEMRAAELHPGRRTDGSQSAPHWITALADSRKIVLLCSFCRGKFNPRKNGYRKMYVSDITGKTDGHVANGMCDACKAQTVLTGGGTAFISEETYKMVNTDPVEARRLARMRSGAAWGRHTLQATRRASEAAGRKGH